MEIKEITDKVSKAFEGNGMLIACGVFGVVFLIAYMVQSKQEQESASTVQITGSYSRYPDTVTNANTITDTMQESTDYQTDQLKSYIDEQLKELRQEYLDNYGEPIDLSNDLSKLYAQLEELKNTNTEQYNNILKEIESNPILRRDWSIALDSPSSLGGSITGNADTDYYSATTYKGVSIVDGLKSVGDYAGSSFAGRKQIAKVNGIKNYTGTAEQNTKMLNLLKAGKLRRA